MKFVLFYSAFYLLLAVVSGFWDDATTTALYIRTDTIPRQSFFRWQEAQSTWYKIFYPYWDWYQMSYNRRTSCVAGISIDLMCLTTASILNRRTLLTAANVLDPWYNRQRDLRVWALGNFGHHKTPYRYRVWRTTRLFPKSLNPEHWHGPRGSHSPRHDLCIIHTLDQMFLFKKLSQRGMYPVRSYLIPKHKWVGADIWYTGSGYEYPLHIKENYKIFIALTGRDYIVDCSKYLPKWWGKFICIINKDDYPGVQNGGGLHEQLSDFDYTLGIGCFEIRYNEERIIVFTDLRYYFDWIYLYGEIYAGEYYEYAYPQWGVHLGMVWNTFYGNSPSIPGTQIQDDLWPLGKK